MHYADLNRLNSRSLIKMARETFDKALPKDVKKNDAVKMLVDMFAEDGDPVLGNPTTAEHERDALVRPKKRIRIIIHSSENQEQDVFLAANGRSILVKRDEEVDIPYPHFEVLQHAMQGSLERMEGDIPVIKQVRRFNFQVIGEVDVATNTLTR